MSTTTQSPKPKRRWYQFSLKTLLVVMTVTCVWLAIISDRARRQRAAVDRIHELGGTLLYNYETGSSEYKGDDPPGPDWLVELIGVDYFDDVVAVRLRDLPVTDADLDLVRDLPDLRGLSISRTKVTDAGLAHLTALTKLERLDLDGTNITVAGIKKLQQALPKCLIIQNRRRNILLHTPPSFLLSK